MATSGSPLEAFTDFVLHTGPAFLTGWDDVINELTFNTYSLKWFLAGKEMNSMLQGGAQIKDNILLTQSDTFENYDPNAEFTYQNPQNTTEWSVPWRFSKADLVYTHHEIGLNAGEMSTRARVHKFKTLKRTKQQDTWNNLVNGLEQQMWAPPSYADMEATTGKVPYSIPATVNEFANGVPGGWTGTATQGIDNATYPLWDNKRITYNEGAVVGSDIFSSMRLLYNKLRFESMPVQPNLAEPTTSPAMIYCSNAGSAVYEGALRVNQDSFVVSGRQDPTYNAPTFRGVPVMFVDELDYAQAYTDTGGTALLGEYDASTSRDGTSLGAHADTSTNGPRYYFCNSRYYQKVFHRDRMFYAVGPFSPSGQPFTNIIVYDVWHNNVNRARSRHGIMSPATLIPLPSGAGL